jgi:hypothetical protein
MYFLSLLMSPVVALLSAPDDNCRLFQAVLL